jgi:predicted transcriptional regulator
MRTTLTLDDDLAQELQVLARQSRSSFKTVLNHVLRRGLSVGEKPSALLPPFVVDAQPGGFRPGIDFQKLNQLNDELEIEAAVEKELRSATERP